MDDASGQAGAYRTAIGRVAVIGTGVIGASWVSQCLARGLDVVATDPAPGAEAALRETVARHWPVLEQIGLAPGASPDRLTFVAGPEEAAVEADFVQENGPERLEIKHATFARLDAAAAPDVVLATSSSGLTPSAIQAACRHPGRVVLGHPFNPPHLVPLVEVLGGEKTDEGAVAAAMAFYQNLGKRPIRLRRELVGHVANRLQAALWREAFHLVGTGAATVA
ncbi:3-hydroxyacyl-CoA dehydrogenase NAD-binding domain-containing protein, partial [uncultured Methylobacterium sp.]|uniref:3-hydroxyacyl-CoA dehydrogenase NAD-binding domain-containing protein n=1 Tax=uncultured Methylobacterium sp. TaxID=157278 RepID=UPI0025913DF6